MRIGGPQLPPLWGSAATSGTRPPAPAKKHGACRRKRTDPNQRPRLVLGRKEQYLHLYIKKSRFTTQSRVLFLQFLPFFPFLFCLRCFRVFFCLTLLHLPSGGERIGPAPPALPPRGRRRRGRRRAGILVVIGRGRGGGRGGRRRDHVSDRPAPQLLLFPFTPGGSARPSPFRRGLLFLVPHRRHVQAHRQDTVAEEPCS